MGRWRRAWQGLTGLPPEDERAEGRRRAREQRSRRLRRLRVWRRWLQRLRWIEPGGVPLTVLRWLAGLWISLGRWGLGAGSSDVSAERMGALCRYRRRADSSRRRRVRRGRIQIGSQAGTGRYRNFASRSERAGPR